jgi:hypothetical protein
MHLQPSELSRMMAAMRVWLDEQRFEPSGFSCRDSGADVLVRVDFKVTGEADAFAQHFGGRVDEVLPGQSEQGLVGAVSRAGLASREDGG